MKNKKQKDKQKLKKQIKVIRVGHRIYRNSRTSINTTMILPYYYYLPGIKQVTGFSFTFVFVSFLFRFCLFRCPFLATKFFAGYSFCPFIPFCLIALLFFSDRVPGLVWFCSVDLVTTAGFVADQLLMGGKQQQTSTRLTVFILLLFLIVLRVDLL